MSASKLLIHLQGIDCAESIDGEANAFKCKITPHLIMMLLIAAGTANCHLSCMLPCVCSVRTECFLLPTPTLILSNFSLNASLCQSVVMQDKCHQVRSSYFISTPDAVGSVRAVRRCPMAFSDALLKSQCSKCNIKNMSQYPVQRNR